MCVVISSLSRNVGRHIYQLSTTLFLDRLEMTTLVSNLTKKPSELSEGFSFLQVPALIIYQAPQACHR